MLLGCSVASPPLVSPHVYFSIAELCSGGYLPWENAARKQHVWGRVDGRARLLMAQARKLWWNRDISPGVCSLPPPTPWPPSPGSGGGAARPPRVLALGARGAGLPRAARAPALPFALRPTLINQTLSMNESVIKEINCRNTCTNKNPLTYLPGSPSESIKLEGV